MTLGVGNYVDSQGDDCNEAVHIFTIAMTPEGFERLRAVALGFVIMRGEESVYLVDTYGDVHFVTVDDADMAEAAMSGWEMAALSGWEMDEQNA